MPSFVNTGNDDAVLNVLLQLVKDKHVRLNSVQIEDPYSDVLDPSPVPGGLFVSFPDMPVYNMSFTAITARGAEQLKKAINLKVLKP